MQMFSGIPVVRLSWLAIFCACGPIQYTGQVSRRATAQLAAAEAVDARTHAPYYYTLAVEYLHQARVEAAEADFEAANRFGAKAEDAAATAREVAIGRARERKAPKAQKATEESFPESSE